MSESNNKKEMGEKGISRRNFFKATGLVTALAGIGIAAKAAPALAGEKSESTITNLAIKQVSKPPYSMFPYSGSENLKRYDDSLDPFYNKQLSKERFGGRPWFMVMEETVIKKIKNNEPGYGLPEQTLSDAGWTSHNFQDYFYSWKPLGVTHLERLAVVGKWEGSPDENNKIAKKAAHVFGIPQGAVGVTTINEQWFYEKDKDGIPTIFSDTYDKPTVTKEAKYIPTKMKSVIVMLIPMDREVLEYTPSAMGESIIGKCYSNMAEVASKMAEFIRGLGYNAIPMGNDTSLSVPLAIDAGLGELGRHGVLVNPVYGSTLRICKVLTDMPIAADKPISFGVAEFCRNCMKCADNCPSQSISKDKDPSDQVKCPSNNKGMKKWYVNTWGCLKFWTENGTDCATCITVCPYSKPQTWIHDLVKGVSAKTPVLDSTFRTLDDALGYGRTFTNKDPSKFWK